MKRLVWLFLAVFCTALAQVPRVELPVAPHESCDCCDRPGACGMPECALPPAAMPTACSSEPQLTVARPAVSSQVARIHGSAAKFWAGVIFEPVAMPPSREVAVDTSPPRQVPLFKAHCAFLI